MEEKISEPKLSDNTGRFFKKDVLRKIFSIRECTRWHKVPQNVASTMFELFVE